MFYIRGLPPERTNMSNWGYRQTLPRGLPLERINTSNWGYRQTLPRGLPSERTNTSNWRYRQTLPEVFHQRGPTHPTEEDRQTLLRRLPSERTKTSNRGGYRQTLLRGLPSDQTTTKPQEIKTYRHYIKEEPAVADQRVSNSWAKYINKGEIL
jgi:hypothetical protein